MTDGTFTMPKSAVALTAIFEEYSFIGETDGYTWTAGSEAGFTIAGNGHRADFVKAFVDGNELGAENFEVVEGSTILTLKPAYLAKLSLGEHDLKMVWNNGELETSFTIVKPAEEKKDEKVAPLTGATSVAAAFAAAFALILGGLFVSRKARA